MKKKIVVIGAIIENQDKEILCALRSPRMALPNLWEFPGGKVEEGETLQETIKREIKEELDCEVEANNEVFNDYTHEYEKFIVQLKTIKCKIISGIPIAKEHSKLVWLKRDNLVSLNWAPADIPALEQLIVEV